MEGSATEGSLTNAIEITNYIVPRSLTSALDKQEVNVSSGYISFDRKSLDTLLIVDTESSAASDDLDTISIIGFAEADKITIRGADSGRVTTVKDGTGNIELQGSTDFATGDTQTALELQLIGGTWYETGRSTQSVGSMSDYRTAGFGVFSVDTFNTAIVGTGGTVAFTAGTNSNYQKLTGSAALASNQVYQLSVPGAVNGDKFVMEYDASVIVGAFALSIFGISLTAEQAKNGGLIIESVFMSGAWYPRIYPNINDSSANTFEADTEFYKDESVTVDKVETTLKTDLMIVPISWDANRLGDHKIVMPFPCTVLQIDTYLDDTIEATDDADFDIKDNAGLSMGNETFVGGAVIGAGKSITPSVNNVFSLGHIMTITTTKTTAGGNAKASIIIQKQ